MQNPKKVAFFIIFCDKDLNLKNHVCMTQYSLLDTVMKSKFIQFLNNTITQIIKTNYCNSS